MREYKYLYPEHKNTFTETNICKKKEMINILCSEIRLFFIDNNNIEIALIIVIPIKIDGIMAHICIRKNHEEMYTYMFETINIHMHNPPAEGRFRIIIFESKNYFENLIELFDEISTIIDTYVCFGKYIISPKKYEFYCKNPDICPKTEMCSVCFENTCVYTLCKHPLCFKCIDTLIEFKNKNCPICRQTDVDIIYTEKDGKQEHYQYDDMEMLDLDTFLDNNLLEETITLSKVNKLK